MINKREVISEIERLTGIKILVEAYEEIAATRMRRIRNSVLQSRGFLEGLTQVYKEVQASYKDQIERLMKKKKVKDKSKLFAIAPKNGKTVSVLISANTGLYGDIIKRTFFLFLENVKKGGVDLAIIGKLGRDLFEEEGLKTPYEYFDLPDSSVDEESLKKISHHLAQYEKIVVFYGQFQNVVSQNPTMANISDTELGKGEEGVKIKYLFEPSLEKIMVFFETEIFASIFEQTVHESQLAKFASRMITLDGAIENIKETLKKVEFQKRLITHRTINRKQLESLSGMNLWKK